MATTDDSMDDDVFEAQEDINHKIKVLENHHIDRKCNTPSPTGYRGYQPPAEVLNLCRTNILNEVEVVIHKTILLGDSGVGKTSLLVKFDTGKFESGKFSATVGIGFTECICYSDNLNYQKIYFKFKQIIMNGSNFDNKRNIVRVKSIKRNGNRCEDQDEDEGFDHNQVKQFLESNEEILDPYTIKRRESIKSDVFDIYVKVMLLGDSGVGKTCMLMRFRDGLFLSGNFISTVGVDFRTKVVEVDDTKVKLQIWDTAGQERFRSVTHAYYRDAHALLLLYDVTNKNSFDNIRAWLGEIREYAQDNVVIMLLGNKADCGGERAVRREDGERLAREYNVTFMETSAKSGQNVELAFHAIAKDLKYRQNGHKDPARFNVQDYVREQSQCTPQQHQCPPCNY